VPYNTSHTTNTHKPQNQTQKRCSHPLCNTQHTTTPQPPQPPPHPHTDRHRSAHHTGCVRRSRAGSGHQKKQPTNRQDVFSGPNSVPNPFHQLPVFMFHPATPPQPCQECGSKERKTPQHSCEACPPSQVRLLRKEVIQPHLPVRLPCYDFVPIAGPTFDHSPPPRGLGHGLRVLPTFVT
jgi:hypothetical protein